MQVDMVSIGFNAKELSTEKKADENGKAVLDESGEEQPVADTGISFPSSDGFKIYMDFSAVWGIMPQQAPDIVRRFGNIDAVEQKVIVPQCESICRNNGSKLGAVELLVGDSRQKFQADVDAAFNKVLTEKNISLLYGLVRHIYIPKEVREPIQKGYVANELVLTRNQQTTTAKMEARLREAEQRVLLEAAKITEGTKKLVAETTAGGPKRGGNHHRRNREKSRGHRPQVRRNRRPEDRGRGRSRERRQEDATGSQGPVVRVGREGLRRAGCLHEVAIRPGLAGKHRIEDDLFRAGNALDGSQKSRAGVEREAGKDGEIM